MSAVRAVAAQTRRVLWRDGRLPVALALIALLGMLSIALGAQRAAESERDRIAAEAVDRDTFANQGARNPHSVAHFSRFAFRPLSATATLDPGIGAYAGSAVWMEAHYQDPANLRTAEDRVDLGRFAELSLAWLVQVLLPLLVIALGFDALAGERERGTWTLSLGSGATPGALVRGKALALVQVFGGALLGLLVLQIVASIALFDIPIGELAARALTWVFANAVYLGVWIALTLAASLALSSTRATLVTLLAGWALLVLIVPRLAATLADTVAPAPTPAAFAADIRRDLDEGIDGHDPAGARRAAFEQQVLAQYGKQTVEELPVSFAGLSLQESEDYGNRVFDRHHGQLAERYRAQEHWRRAAAVLSPLPVLQHLSMAAAGTDIAHHIDFIAQAERKRREIVLVLNQDMIDKGAGQDFDYLADPALWRRTPEFDYALPSFARQAPRYAIDALILLLWLGLATLLLRAAIRRVEHMP